MNELIAATAGQVADAERAIDASLEAMPLPANEYFQSLWHFLTVSEDLPRLFAVRSSGKISEHGDSDEVMRLSSIIDDNKYALRYVMDVIARRLPRAKKLLKKYLEYEPFGRGFDATWHFGDLGRLLTRIIGLTSSSSAVPSESAAGYF
jgi:hypothetical protein